MAYRRTYRRSRRSRGSSRSRRNMRWIVTGARNATSIAIGGTGAIQMLSPLRPPAAIEDELYQSMVRCTVVRIMGHVTVRVDDSGVSCTTGNAQAHAEYAWGIYKEPTFDPTQVLLPYSQGYSNDWMTHTSGSLWLPSTQICPSGIQTFGSGGETFRRHTFDLKRYKRTLDPSMDTLVWVIENSSDSDILIFVTSYFRMLVME